MVLGDRLPPKSKFRGLALGVILLLSLGLGAFAAGSGAMRVVDGELSDDGHFRARALTIYEAGMFLSNPVVVRADGIATASKWYKVELPGLRSIDQVRVYSSAANITAYYTDGEFLRFSAIVHEGVREAAVEVYYFPGSASWQGHYELDFERAEISLVARIDWRAKVVFRDVELQLVSGRAHTVPPSYSSPSEPRLAASPGGSPFNLPRLAASPVNEPLRAFEVPESADTGIYVVHKVQRADQPAVSTFFVRVFTSPVAVRSVIVFDSASLQPLGPERIPLADSKDPPLFIELSNSGGFPWMPGRADIYRDGILAGSDMIEYTSRGGTQRTAMGWSLDVKVARDVTDFNGTRTVSYNLTNRDNTPYTVEIRQRYTASEVTSLGPFHREGDEFVLAIDVPAGTTLSFSWKALVPRAP